VTVQQAIEKANDYRAGNAVPDEIKLAWLNDIEHQIYDDVIRTHLHDFRYSRWWHKNTETGKWEFLPCPEYTEDNTNTELIAEHPYDLLYVWYLVAQIDLTSQEMTLYNASAALHNSYMQRYKNKYHNEHRPVPTPRIKVGAFR
jgi:hypothetical protein